MKKDIEKIALEKLNKFIKGELKYLADNNLSIKLFS
jgi:hypothetical protein